MQRIVLMAGTLLFAAAFIARADSTLETPEQGSVRAADDFESLGRFVVPKAAPQPSQPACPAPASGEGLSDYSGPTLQDVRPAPALPAFSDDLDKGPLLKALANSRDYLGKLPADQRFRLGTRKVTAEYLKRSVEALSRELREASGSVDLEVRLRRRFDVYESVANGGGNKVTVTAYYDAELDVTKTPDADHPYAVYGRPRDLVRLDPSLGLPYDYGRPDGRGGFEPHFSRQEVMDGSLADQGLELAYFHHPADLLILQTEGSGSLVFPDGSRRRVAFDGANGWPYRSVGQSLIACGLIPKGSTGLPLVAFLKSQTLEMEAEYVNLNARYTYFTPQSEDGVYGAIGAPLVADRSIAVDPGPIPLGSAGLLETTVPLSDAKGNIIGEKRVTRLVAAQDTGAAIRGPGRVDYYLGGGAKASAEAHSLLAPGRLFILVLKSSGQ